MNHPPIFPATEEIHVHDDRPTHLVVEGENLTALRALVDAGTLVDLIYIDPPYNTGVTDRKYVDVFDAWSEFIRERLALARQLLTPTGVIVIAIDNAELGNLRGVCDGVFGARNFLTTLIWQGGVKNSARFTGGGVDYMVVYGRSKQKMIDADIRWREPKDGVQDILDAGAEAWSATGNPELATAALRSWWRGRKGDYAAGLTEYSRVDEAGRVFRVAYLGAPTGRGSGRYTYPHPTTGLPVKNPPADWVCSTTTMDEYVAQGRVLFGADETETPRRKLFLEEHGDQAPLPTFSQRRDVGTNHLEDILGEHRFTNPKDHRVLARWFAMMAGPDATILDFFAGSGTTGEAVMALNAGDGGRRRAILVTSNEVSTADQKALTADGWETGDTEWEARGVYRRVLQPRIQTIVTGIREDGSRYSDGFADNVVFARA